MEKSINIRLAEFDLKKLKQGAEELGLLVRKYVRGELKN